MHCVRQRPGIMVVWRSVRENRKSVLQIGTVVPQLRVTGHRPRSPRLWLWRAQLRHLITGNHFGVLALWRESTTLDTTVTHGLLQSVSAATKFQSSSKPERLVKILLPRRQMNLLTFEAADLRARGFTGAACNQPQNIPLGLTGLAVRVVCIARSGARHWKTRRKPFPSPPVRFTEGGLWCVCSMCCREQWQEWAEQACCIGASDGHA